MGAVITATLERVHGKQIEAGVHDALLLTLAQLYTYERKYDRALDIYMSLGDKQVFVLIQMYRLFPRVSCICCYVHC